MKITVSPLELAVALGLLNSGVLHPE